MNSLQAIAFWKALPKEKQDEIYNEMTTLKNPGEPLYDGKTSVNMVQDIMYDYRYTFDMGMPTIDNLIVDANDWVYIPHLIIVELNQRSNYKNLTNLFYECLLNYPKLHAVIVDTIKFIKNTDNIAHTYKNVTLMYEQFIKLNSRIKEATLTYEDVKDLEEFPIENEFYEDVIIYLEKTLRKKLYCKKR
jgi:hypothetical protein